MTTTFQMRKLRVRTFSDLSKTTLQIAELKLLSKLRLLPAWGMGMFKDNQFLSLDENILNFIPRVCISHSLVFLCRNPISISHITLFFLVNIMIFNSGNVMNF